ncbi:hypothetical protein ACFY71_39480 [Streptomyces cinerochromogenes]|uniref:Uncharacterized protein n=1 Tax=Streptomyces cinerochromogenes TaxID=66422 RepID=A0ABW7BL57_9ACTN
MTAQIPQTTLNNGQYGSQRYRPGEVEGRPSVRRTSSSAARSRSAVPGEHL